MDKAFYSQCELNNIGFMQIGKEVLISRKCSIYSPSSIIVGNNVRIDDFCILSGNIKIGDYVHISAFTLLYGSGHIIIESYCGISPRSIIFSASDDFSGEYMVGPLIPLNLSNVMRAPVVLKKYSQLGANTIVMPGVICNEGSVTGAFTFVNKDLDEWSINYGIPCKKKGNRKKNILALAQTIVST